MIKHIYAFRSALALLSILPGGHYSFDKHLSGLSAAYYASIGLVFGIIVLLLQTLMLTMFEQLHANIILFVALIVLYGGLHFDGLSDTIDGLFVEKKRALEVMKDPHAGTMGILFGFLVLLLSLSAFIQIKDMINLIPILAASRFFASFLLYEFDYISHNGIASQIKNEISPFHIIFSAVTLITVMILIDISLIFVLFLGFLSAYSIGLFFKKRYNGINGDILGASILLSELVMFHAVLFI